MGDGSKALVSILAALPQKIPGSVNKKTRINDLGYYLNTTDADTYDGEKGKNATAQVQTVNSAAVSHACCALVMHLYNMCLILMSDILHYCRPTLPQTVS